MKKIMKKALAFMIALAMVVVPMKAMAAVGDPIPTPSWENCIYSGDSVTVEAGTTTYFEIGTNGEVGTYDFKVEGNGDFNVAVCTEGTTEAYAEGESIAATNGVVETSITSFESTYCYAAFSITNNSAEEQNYTCTVVFPEGTQGNPKAVTLAIDVPVQVTVPAGAQYYVAATLPEIQVEYNLEITGNTGFGYSLGWMPNWDNNGSFTTTISSYFDAAQFSIINDTAEEQTYTLTLSNLPLGAQSNPDVLPMDTTTTKVLENSEWWYKGTLEESGTFTFTIEADQCANGWTYNLQHGDVVLNFSTGWDEDDKYQQVIDVQAGDEILLGVSVPTYLPDYEAYDVYTPGAGTVVFTTAFEALSLAEGDPVATPSWENCIYSGDTVTVEPGKTVLFEIGTEGVAGTYDFKVEGADAFDVTVCTEGTSTDYPYTFGTPVSAVNGVVETQITSFESTYGYACFAITNNTDSAKDYVCTIVFPEGTQGNPVAVDLAIDVPIQVTVPAGAQYYIAATLPEAMTEYNLSITGNTGFGYSLGWMPDWDNNGSYTTAISAWFGPASFALINNTAEEQTYTLTLSNMPLGSQSNPDVLPMDTTTTKVLENTDWWYTWTAAESGTFTFVMENESCADGWTYNLQRGDDVLNFSTGWDETDKNQQVLELQAGDVILLGVSVPTYMPEYQSYDVYTPGTGTVVFTTVFEASEVEGGEQPGGEQPGGEQPGGEQPGGEQPDGPIAGEFGNITMSDGYAYNDKVLTVGTEKYTLSEDVDYTIFTFEPTEVGKYTITLDSITRTHAAEGKLGIVSYNGMWISIEPSDTTITETSVEWECSSVGQSIWLAVKGDGTTATISVAKGDVQQQEIPWTTYENVVTPEVFTFDGDADALEYVDVEDDVVDVAVLGSDGYYHLNSADGPILYVNLDDEIMNLVDAMGYGQLKAVYYENDEVVEKVDFNEAFAQYVSCADEAEALYPLTADLMTIYQEVGQSQGWYGEEGWLGFVEEDAWMFACYYLTDEEQGPGEQEPGGQEPGEQEPGGEELGGQEPGGEEMDGQEPSEPQDPQDPEDEDSEDVTVDEDEEADSEDGEVEDEEADSEDETVEDSEDSEESEEAPQGGDNSMITLWIMIMVACTFVLSVVMKKRVR